MDVPSALRLISTKALATIRTVADSDMEGIPPQPYLDGLHRVLRVAQLYTSLFMSKTLSHRTRVQHAGTVVTYLRLWREWVKNRPRDADPEYEASRTKRMNDYITRECAQDMILSCHFIVLLIRVFRDYYPHLECPFELCGSDCCEEFFSSLGSFVMNKRVYSILEALHTTRSKLTLAMLEIGGNVLFPPPSRGGGKWDAPMGCQPNPLNWPNDGYMASDWNTGVAVGYRWATEDKMKPGPLNPRARRNNQRFPPWWTHPHLNDPQAPAKGREEDLYEEAHTDSESDDGSDSNDTEDTSSDDDDDDDNVPLAALHAVAGVVPGEGISMSMSVPGGGRRHKAAVLAELAGPQTTMSADRALRVQQGEREHQRSFNPKSSNWVMALGTDIAIRYEAGNNICMARVIGMRKRVKGRWVRYTQPVQLHEDRTKLGDLYVTCHYYKRVRGAARGGARARGPKVFSFNVSNSDENHVTMVVSPVKLDYDERTKLFTLDPKCDEVIQAQLRGQTEWDPE